MANDVTLAIPNAAGGSGDRMTLRGPSDWPVTDINTLVNVITSLVVVYLTLLALRYTAKPRLRVSLLGHGALPPGETVILRFRVSNRGHWYGRPAATNVVMFLNFPPEFKPIRARYGSSLEKVCEELKPGKGKTNYLKVDGIQLFHEEPGEDIEVEVKLPPFPDTYEVRIAAYSEQGDCGVHKIPIRIG